jgi:hypothetical protein
VMIKSPKIDHMSFTDKPLLTSKPGSGEEARARDCLKTIDTYVRSFFEQFLKGKSTLLDGGVNNGSVLVQHFSPSKGLPFSRAQN